MHGLVNRSIELFLKNTYGETAWGDIVRRSGHEGDGFESMLTYDDELTYRVLDAAADLLEKDREIILEDLGTYLISHESVGSIRRLLRFGGVNFSDFLLSLDELPGRTKLAVSDLVLPELEIVDDGEDRYLLKAQKLWPGFGHVLLGVLRAMADDYGALAFLEFEGEDDETESVSIQLLESAFSEGREFNLTQKAG
ncbi:MAG: heme NO-binding domain-containing protein [Pseudomonadota bacterium]